MKKIFSVICAVALLLQCIIVYPVQAQAAEVVESGTCGENLTWTLDNEGTLTISGTGPMTDYESDGSPWNNNANVKSVIINEGVTSIGDRAFYGCNNLITVTIPDTVTLIGKLTFSNCSRLASIAIPDSVSSIGMAAFQMCESLTTVMFPDSMTVLSDYVLSMCGSLTFVTIPDGVTSIGQYAFQMCESLTSVTIPDSVTTIDQQAFFYCSSLTSVTIPASVTTIGRYAFNYCRSLTGIWVDENNSCYSSDESGVLYSKDKTTLIHAPSKISGSYVIPDGVITVDNYAFDGCSDLTAVSIPGSVTTIFYGAFSDCSGLGSITIPDSVAFVGDNAFNGCSNLTSVTIHDGVTSIGDSAFYGCSSLVSVTIPDSVTVIGDGAFAACDSLNGIWVGENNPSYCNDENGVLFTKDKTMLIQAPSTISGSYVISSGVISIGNSAFGGCSSLTSVTIPNSTTSIGDDAFYGCSSLVSITIPDSVTTIGDEAFAACSSLTSVEIPNNVTYLGCSAFNSCNSLNSVIIPNSVTSINSWTFYWCNNLTSVIIPDSITTIDYGAFSDCYNLANVFYTGNADQKNAVTIDEYNDPLNNAAWHYEVAVQEQDGKTVIYCPECDYYYDPNKAQGKNLSGTCGENLTWTLDAEGTLTISGVGPMADYEWLSFPWHNNGKIKNVIVEEGVTSIAYGAFFLCDHLTSVSIPSSVTFIGGDAFTACFNLTGIWVDENNTSYSSDERGVLFNKDKSTLILAPSGLSGSYSVPNSVVYIDYCAFLDCNDLTSVSISASVASIGSEVFRNCSNLTGIWVDENNTSYSSDERGVLFDKDKTTLIKAPEGLSGSYVMPDSVTSIQSEAFFGCRGLSFVTIPDAVSSIGDGAFAFCYNLTSVIIPDGVTTIGDSMFPDCSSLTAITIPDSVTTIDNYAFYYCDNLKDVFYVGSVDQKNSITVRGDNEALTDAVWHYEVEVRNENGETVIFCPECNCNYNPDGTEYVTSVIQPTLAGKSFTLSFEDEILANFYYTVSDLTSVTEHGMLVFYSDPGTVDIANAVAVYNAPVYDSAKDRYMATTTGIAAKEMGDTRYYCAYAKLSDGTYVYSKVYDYSPKKYAMNMLDKDTTSDKQKALCVAMLNCGAAAQSFFGYNTDSLMNAELTAEQQALVIAYDASLFTGAVNADPSKIGSFAATSGFSKKTATVSFEGAFSVNYYFTPNAAVNGDVMLYIWTPEAYAAADTLTAENAATVTMVAGSDGRYWGQVSGIAAKSLDETYYVAGVYTDEAGNTYCTGIIAYSLSKYCLSKAVDGNAMQELASATAMYGYYAEAYFA